MEKAVGKAVVAAASKVSVQTVAVGLILIFGIVCVAAFLLKDEVKAQVAAEAGPLKFGINIGAKNNSKNVNDLWQCSGHSVK